MQMKDLIQNLVSGASVGCTYGLMGLGVVFLWQSIRRINFANITPSMVAAYVFYILYTRLGLSFVPSLLGTISVVVVYGLGLRFLIYEEIKKHSGGRLEFVVATLMLCTLFLNLMIVFFGSLPRPFPPVFGKPTDFVSLFGVSISVVYVYIFAIVAILVGFLYFFLNKTLVGKCLKAFAQNEEAAILMGVNVNLMRSISFVLSAVVVGIAGILLAPIYFVSLELGGGTIGVKGFASAVLAGLVNPYGAILGGICIGLIENFSAMFISSTYKDVFAFLILITVLLAKPSGIFVGKLQRRTEEAG
jgi:branched-chain amino acid transport system permease protein